MTKHFLQKNYTPIVSLREGVVFKQVLLATSFMKGINWEILINGGWLDHFSLNMTSSVPKSVHRNN
jgi:hypothetical protein